MKAMEPKRILLAENEPADACFIKNALEGAGFLVDTVDESNKAWELLLSNDYAVLFCNFSLTNGWKLMEKAFLDSRLENTMVFAISNEPESRDVMAAIATGWKLYINH